MVGVGVGVVVAVVVAVGVGVVVVVVVAVAVAVAVGVVVAVAVVKLTTLQHDLLWLALYIGGTWACCAAMVRYFPENGVPL